MSIWSSLRVDVLAVDLDDSSQVDMYTGEGPCQVQFDVAVAPAWNNLVRVSIDFSPDSNRPNLEICAGLDLEAVDGLITALTAARDRVKAG
jgi:hypothetical protein